MSAIATIFTRNRYIKWLSKRILGLNYKTKLVMCYACLGTGYYLALTGKDIVPYTGLVGVVLGIYTAGNVTESTAVLKHGGDKTEEG